MKPCCNPVVIVLLVFLLSISLIPCCASPVRDGDPGTIGECLSKADGTEVTLKCEQVMWRGKSGKSFAVKEWFEKWPEKPRILVVSTQPLQLEAYWSVDVTGTLWTLTETTPDGFSIGQRVLLVSPSDIQVYCFWDGQPVPCAFFKMLPSAAYAKRPLSELSQPLLASTISTMSEELPQPPDTPDSRPPSPSSRDSLKWLPDGASVSMNGIVVSAAFNGFFYVERSDKSFGIWVSSDSVYPPGMLLDITGWMATGEGERAVVADTVTCVDWYNWYPVPTAIGMNNRNLGGGAVGVYTPAVPIDLDPSKMGSGLNNTGLLVRIWGKVTYIDSQYGIFYIDDGSGITSDGHPGVKVYAYDSLPAQDSSISVTGVSCAESVTGSTSTIRTLWQRESVSSSTMPGTGTITGTITAAGADTKKVRVYCASASTSVTFTGDTAFYSMNVPYGSHAVTATIPGYKTTTQYVWLDSWNPSQSCDMALPSIGRLMDLVASSPRIPPDGTTEMNITAIVRDEEGRRFGNETVTWGVNPNLVVSADPTTDDVGEARLVIHAPSAASVEAVSVTIGNLSSKYYAEFAEPDAPSIWIMQPSNGETVSGDQEIKLAFGDPGGTYTGLSHVSVIVDGVEYATWPATTGSIWWDSTKVPNGYHEIKAVAVDCDGVTSTSNIVTVTTQNEISEMSVTPDEAALNQPVHISARLATATVWTITVTNLDNQPVWSTTGNGTTINTDWQGPTTTGSYEVTVSTASGTASSQPVVSNPQVAQVLLVAAAPEFRMWSKVQDRIAAHVKGKGLSYIKLTPSQATWDRIKPILRSSFCKYFYFDGHGDWHQPARNVTPGVTVTFIKLKASKHNVYAYRWPGSPAPGSTDPYELEPGWKVAYAREELERTSSPFRIVWLAACYSGYNGADRSTDEYDTENGKFGSMSCYKHISGTWNDMASAFGITPEVVGDPNSKCAYIGWYSIGASGDLRYDGYGTGPNCPGMIVDAWGRFIGNTFEQTRAWIRTLGGTQAKYYLPEDGAWNPINSVENSMVISPFYNWRFWGTSNQRLFD